MKVLQFDSSYSENDIKVVMYYNFDYYGFLTIQILK